MMEHDGTWEEVPLSAWLVDEWFALQASMGSWPFKPRIFFPGCGDHMEKACFAS